MKPGLKHIAAVIGLCAALAGTGAPAGAQSSWQGVRHERRQVLRDEAQLRRLEARRAWQLRHHQYRAARLTASRIVALRARLREDRQDMRHTRR